MQRGTVTHTLVVGIVLLAGCNGFATTGTPTAGDEDIDPGPQSPTDMNTVAPGISESYGLVNASALLQAHSDWLVQTGFDYRFNHSKVQRVWEPDGTNRRTIDIAVRGRVMAEEGLSPYRINETDLAAEQSTTTIRYVDDEDGTERVRRGDNVTVTAYDEEATELLTSHYTLRNFLKDGNWTITAVRDDGVVLSVGPEWSDWTNESAGNRVISEREFVRGRLVVGIDGQIREFWMNRTRVTHVLEDGELLNRGAVVRLFDFELLATNSTTVPQPSWVGSDRNATVTRDSVTLRSRS